MSRLLGNMRRSWCPHCNAEPGPDCPDGGRSPRQQKRIEARQVQREIREES